MKKNKDSRDQISDGNCQHKNSIIERTMDMAFDNKEFFTLMQQEIPEKCLPNVELIGKTPFTLKDLLKTGIPKEDECFTNLNCNLVLCILWNILCVHDGEKDNSEYVYIRKKLEEFLDLKCEGEDQYFLSSCWEKKIVQHIYSKDGKTRLEKYYLPPISPVLYGLMYHRIYPSKSPRPFNELSMYRVKPSYYIGKCALESYVSTASIKGVKKISENENKDMYGFLTQMLLDRNLNRTDEIIKNISSLSKESRKECTQYFTQKISTMLSTSYRMATLDKWTESESMSETTSCERRNFDKIFEITGVNVYFHLEEGTLPPLLGTMVTMICMKEFTKNFMSGTCNRFDHMDIWDKWRKTTTFTKAFCIYNWMKKLVDNICMECGKQFDFPNHTLNGTDPVLIRFSIPLNALSPNISIPVFTCCSTCCNTKDMVFVGDTFFYGVIPSASIMRKDGIIVNIYLLRMLRFLKSAAVVIQRDIFQESKKMTTISGDLTGEMYINEESYLEKIDTGVHANKDEWNERGIKLELDENRVDMYHDNATDSYEDTDFLRKEMLQTSSDCSEVYSIPFRSKYSNMSAKSNDGNYSFSSIRGYRHHPYSRKSRMSTNSRNIRSPCEDIPPRKLYTKFCNFRTSGERHCPTKVSYKHYHRKRRRKQSPQEEFIKANSLYKEICGNFDDIDDSGYTSDLNEDSEEEFTSGDCHHSPINQMRMQQDENDDPPVDILGSI